MELGTATAIVGLFVFLGQMVTLWRTTQVHTLVNGNTRVAEALIMKQEALLARQELIIEGLRAQLAARRSNDEE